MQIKHSQHLLPLADGKASCAVLYKKYERHPQTPRTIVLNIPSSSGVGMYALHFTLSEFEAIAAEVARKTVPRQYRYKQA
jgi:hypothetical protein